MEAALLIAMTGCRRFVYYFAVDQRWVDADRYAQRDYMSKQQVKLEDRCRRLHFEDDLECYYKEAASCSLDPLADLASARTEA